MSVFSPARADSSGLDVAPGSLVEVRDEEWLVTHVEMGQGGALITVQGLSELVRDTTAKFYEGLDEITVLDPAQTTVRADDSPGYRRARLWVEALLRKTPLPMDDASLAVTDAMLVDSLDYQRQAVSKALDPATFRPRILLADTVGLGKTLEIGMILAELIRRGRGERILVVTPRHVLEQMQHELWTRFAIPFVRLDSTGIQRVRRDLPASRNPFSKYKRAIISIDTLKNDRYLAHLRKHRWDAVVIDESHNVTNDATQNHRLASTLAQRTEALILASATPHNGRRESFAGLIRMLDPTAVNPDGSLVVEEVGRLLVRRHRHSPEVAGIVGPDWAERKEPRNVLVPASPQEDAVADLLVDRWLYPSGGEAVSGKNTLFPWTLAKAFLSSPAALAETARNRQKAVESDGAEDSALTQLLAFNAAADGASGKYTGLHDELVRIGIGPNSSARVVVFAERVATLKWLQDKVSRDFEFKPGQVEILHGGLNDVHQQQIVESFKQATSPIRVLVTGDVASEGVNLHLQCHELIHYDIPWSLIRIEQRNGRIDRYRQRKPPQITTLLVKPTNERFSGDVRVLTRLMEREHEAHRALGDAASLMGQYDVKAEESAILDVLRHRAEFDDVVADASSVAAGSSLAALMNLAGRTAAGAQDPAPSPSLSRPAVAGSTLYPEPVDFLREAMRELYVRPQDASHDDGSGGVGWTEDPAYKMVELTPPRDLKRRLEVLPQSYLADRQVTQRLRLVTSKKRGGEILQDALTDESDSTWPQAHYLGPLHPVLDWASDRVLASLTRNEVFAVRGETDTTHVLLQGSLSNRAGQTVSVVWMAVEFMDPGNPSFPMVQAFDSAAEMFQAVGFTEGMSNPGPVADAAGLSALMGPAVAEAESHMRNVFDAATEAAERRVREWIARADRWDHDSGALIQTADLRNRRGGVEEERRLADQRRPDRRFVRPLLVVVPADHAVATRIEETR